MEGWERTEVPCPIWGGAWRSTEQATKEGVKGKVRGDHTMVEGSGREGGQFGNANVSNLRATFAFDFSFLLLPLVLLYIYIFPITLVRKRYFLQRLTLLSPGLDT